LVELLGLSASRFDVVLRPQFPRESTKGSGAKLLLDARVAVQLLVDYRVELATNESTGEEAIRSEDDPWLRRFRQARAVKLETETDLLRRKIIPVDEVMAITNEFASAMRQFADFIRRENKYLELIDLYRSLVERAFENLMTRFWKEAEQRAISDFTAEEQAGYLSDVAGRDRDLKEFISGSLQEAKKD
jgi:hypothetical protein